MPTAIFYRHWLELRRPTLIVGAAVLLAAIGYGFAVTGVTGYFASSGKLVPEIARYEAIRPMGTGPGMIPAAIHALVAAFLGLFASGSFAGGAFSGSASIRNSSPHHPSVYVTASLPVSRAGLQLTRLIAGFGSLLAVLGLSLVLHVIVLLILRQPIPIVTMSGTTLMAAAGGLGLMAVVGLITVISSGTLSGIAMFAAIMTLWLTDAGWDRTVDFVSPRASMFGAAALTAATMAALSVVFMRRKEL